jgi:hypothetical protein
MAWIAQRLVQPAPTEPGDSRKMQMREILSQPGVSLIMPSEQLEDFIDGRPPYIEFLGNRPRGGRPADGRHERTTFARVFVNEVADPYMKSENLRFPVGSVIVREKLASADATRPELIAAMIKHERSFSPRTNGWEFIVIDRNLTRIKTRQTTGNCAACHEQARSSDLVYKSYLR